MAFSCAAWLFHLTKRRFGRYSGKASALLLDSIVWKPDRCQAPIRAANFPIARLRAVLISSLSFWAQLHERQSKSVSQRAPAVRRNQRAPVSSAEMPESVQLLMRRCFSYAWNREFLPALQRVCAVWNEVLRLVRSFKHLSCVCKLLHNSTLQSQVL